MMSLVLIWLGLAGPPKLPPLPHERIVEPPKRVVVEQEPAPESSPEVGPAPSTPGAAASPPASGTPPKSPGTSAKSAPKRAPNKSATKAPGKSATKAHRKPAHPVASSSPDAKGFVPPPLGPLEPLPVATQQELERFQSDDDMAKRTGDGKTKVERRRGSRAPGDRPDSAAGPSKRTASPATPKSRLTVKGRAKPPLRSSAFMFGYRLFQIEDGLGRPQSWHLASVEVTPVRRWVRLNLITELGVEGGPAARNGGRSDILFLQKAGLGVQYPHFVTPFVEFQGGAGFARVELFDHNEMLFAYTLGLDVGAQWAVTKWMFLHGAVGWIRPVFSRPGLAVVHDSFTFKLGVGF